MSNDPRQASTAEQINAYNATIIEEFRANGGRVTGPLADLPMMLLTHTGAKSGKQYTSPLAYSTDGDRFVVIASMRGAPTNPQWFSNVVANPTVTVEVPGETFRARARVAEGEERDRLYRAQADLMPVFDEYQARTTRLIPVVVLERI
jgi:deazaflavin-dependent oxidoreductase (nitroreductase family)